MTNYIIRRLMGAVLVLFLMSIVVFRLVHWLPGDALLVKLGEAGRIPPDKLEQARAEMGIDKPLVVQYANWLTDVLRGDLGRSLIWDESVMSRIRRGLPITLELAVLASLVALLIAIPVGIISATRQYSAIDNTVTVGSFLGLALPNFWLALLLQLYISVQLGWLPAISTGQAQAPFPERLKFFILPVIVLALPTIAFFARFMRSAMLEVIRQDYITAARAKGLANRAVLYRHGLRNALIPMITVVGLQLPRILGGAVIIEQIFAWPGIGLLVYDAITRRDYPVILGVTLLTGAFVMIVNILVDFFYVLVDPRVSLTDRGH